MTTPVQGPQSPEDEDVEAALSAFSRGDFVGALGLADALLKTAPANEDGLHIRANALHGLGRIPEAMDAFTAVFQVNPHNVEAWMDMADMASGTVGDNALALTALQRALEAAMPEDATDSGEPELAVEVLLRLVDVCAEDGDYDEAAAYAQQARDLCDEPDAAVEVAVASVAFEVGRLKDAQDAVAAAMQADKKAAGAHYLAALLLERRGDIAGAADAMARAVRLDPENYKAGVVRTREQLAAMFKEVIEDLQEPVKALVASAKFTVKELPEDKELLSSEDGDTLAGARVRVVAQPPEVIVYWRNLLRGLSDDDEVKATLWMAVLTEAADALDLSEEQMDAMLDLDFEDEDEEAPQETPPPPPAKAKKKR